MAKLLLTRGLPGSGKTSFATWWVDRFPETRARVSRDDLRAMFFAESVDWGPAQEKLVTIAERAAVKALLDGGRDVVIDATHLRPKYVREWARFAAGHDATVDVVGFPISLTEAIYRDADRAAKGGRYVGERVIRTMADKFLPNGEFLPLPNPLVPPEDPADGDTYVPDPLLPRTVIVDIDGTVALRGTHPGARGPHDLHRVGEDTPNETVIALVRLFADAGYSIVYLSGREDSCRAATARWINEHDLPGGALFMRATGDRRRDSIIKRELFDAHIRSHYAVELTIDDRNQVVAMWRGLGLTCLQVAEGNF